MTLLLQCLREARIRSGDLDLLPPPPRVAPREIPFPARTASRDQPSSCDLDMPVLRNSSVLKLLGGVANQELHALH